MLYIIRRSKTQVKMEYTMSGIYNNMVPCIILCRRHRDAGVRSIRLDE